MKPYTYQKKVMNDKVLIIDDSPSIRNSLKDYLSDLKLKILSASEGEEGLKVMKREPVDLVVTDLRMPGIDGIKVLRRVKELDRNLPVIVMTTLDDVESTIEAMQAGAYDCIEKPVDPQKLITAVRRAIKSKKLGEQFTINLPEGEFNPQTDIKLIGKTPQMKDIFKKTGQISSSKVTVLLQGESGTGKELIARMIHYSGITKNHPFVAVNCTAVTESLLESEFFGHIKGSFTGATRDKKGKFELAGEGTILLDEISEITPDLQVKLLRVIQEKEFERVGGEFPIPMKARIIAATNRDLQKLVAEGKFREDLYYRLNVFSINIPPLRERREDIPDLVVHFLRKINQELHKSVTKIPYDVMENLQNYNWIGNVRELENTLMQAVVLSNGDVLEMENILLRHKESEMNPIVDRTSLSLADVEKEQIQLVLNHLNWDKRKACQVLGISKPTLYSKIATYDLVPPKKD